ncbi:MAG: CDP-alcohol phosphatidyltransferase family protein [Pseudomonadota bacterium]
MSFIPNALTLMRCVLAFIAGWTVLMAGHIGPFGEQSMHGSEHALALVAPFGVFLLAAGTDFLDGWAARALNAQSAFGAWLDPIADKLLVAAVLIPLSWGFGWSWDILAPTIAIVGRDVAITFLREVQGNPPTLVVSPFAKIKTAAELAAIGAILAAIACQTLPLGAAALKIAWSGSMAIGFLLIWAAAAMSLLTGARYARAAFFSP